MRGDGGWDVAGVEGGEEFIVGHFVFFGFLRVLRAVGLEATEFIHGFAAFSIKTGFLLVVVAELLLIGEVRLEQDHVVALVFGNMIEGISELRVTVGVEREFEGLDAALAPETIDDDLNKFGFKQANGLEISLEVGQKGGVFLNVFVRKQDGLAGERGFNT